MSSGMLIRSTLKERRNDLYETPAEAVHALLGAETLPRVIWEPACGPGAIVRVLRSAGHDVLATDLVAYDSADQDHGGRDFLLEQRAAAGVEAIVTNPPFKLAAEFVAHALRLCPRVIMLLRLSFLESARRAPILDTGQLARVHVFRNRLPMMHRDGWTGPRVSNPTPFAWLCWDRAHRGPPTLHRLSWTSQSDAQPSLDPGPLKHAAAAATTTTTTSAEECAHD